MFKHGHCHAISLIPGIQEYGSQIQEPRWGTLERNLGSSNAIPLKPEYRDLGFLVLYGVFLIPDINPESKYLLRWYLDPFLPRKASS